MRNLWILVAGLLFFTSSLFCAGRTESKDGRGDLLGATIKAIDLEIESTKEKLEAADSEASETFRQKLRDLEAERARFAAMKPDDYPSPESQPVGAPPVGAILPPMTTRAVINVTEPLSDGSLLDVQGATRSGPFYHLAGIKGGDYGVFKPGSTYTVELCLVYRREYFGFIGDYYVYVLSVH